MSKVPMKTEESAVAVGPSAPAFQWSDRRERAAYLLAEDELTDLQIAAEVDINPDTLYSWKRRVEFGRRIQEHIDALGAAVVGIGIARRRNRIARLQRMVDRIEQVIEARSANELDAPGGESGLIVSKPIFSALGDLRHEHKFDAALLREYRATLEQVAKERGQLTEKVEITQETLIRQYVGVNIELV